MKRALPFSLLILLAALFSCTASTDNEQTQDKPVEHATFSWTWGDGQGQEADDVVALESGGFIVMARRWWPSKDASKAYGKGDILLYCISDEGEVQWTRYLGGEESEWGNEMIATSDGGVLITGLTKSTDVLDFQEKVTSDVYLAKVSAKGELVWEQNYGRALSDEGLRILPVDTGGYLILATSEQVKDVYPYVPPQDVYLLKIDEQGKKEWEQFLLKPRQTTPPIGLVNRKELGMGILWSRTKTADSKDRWPCMTAYTPEGQLDTNYFIGASAGILYNAQNLADGGLILVGSTGGIDNRAATLIRTDAQQQVLWAQQYPQRSASKGIQTQDDGFALVGSENTGPLIGGKRNLWAIRTDAEGTQTFQHTWVESRNRIGSSIMETAKGGFVITGSSSAEPGAKPKMLLVKTKPDLRNNFTVFSPDTLPDRIH